jgi:hypothetical protein
MKTRILSLPKHGTGPYKSIEFYGFNFFGITRIKISHGGYKLNPIIHYPRIATHFQILRITLSIIYNTIS